MGKGGGGGQPTQTTSNVTNTNVPDYARPYVENMLSATQSQLFKMDGSNISGFQPYKAYGGTYDEAGNQTAYDPSKAIAGFSPLQQRAMDMSSGPEGFAQNVGGYMSPYMQNVTDIQKREAARQSGIQGIQQQAQATQAGAFGGSRDAIQRAERERNLAQQMGDIQAQGSQAAFANAQQQFNTNLGQMSAAGALQQQNQQQAINQAMQDYANAQQYPLMQLGTMSNMLRGLPMQAQTTQQYQAQANPITQGIGAIGSLGSLAQMKAEGGAVKSMASGGITSVPRYDVGGAVLSQLSQKGDEELAKEARESPSKSVREMAAKILQTRRMGADPGSQVIAAAPQGVGPMGVDYNAGYAGGGIIAFATGEKVDAEEAARNAKQTEMYVEGAKLAAANQPASQGIPPLLDRNAPAFTPNTTRGSSTAKVIPTVPEGYVPDVIASPRGGVKLDLSDRDKNPLKDKTFGSKEEALAAYRNSIHASASIPVLQKRAVPAAPEALPPLTDAQRQAMVAGAQKAIQGGRKSGVLTASPAAVVAPKTTLKAASQAVPQVVPQAAQEAGPAVSPLSVLQGGREPIGIDSVPVTDSTTAPAVDPLADIRTAAKNAQANADKTQEQIYKENLAALKAQGLDTSEARDQYMKAQQAQRADTEKSFQNREYLRRAEFFASWGSTPGNTLVAGMTALKKTIPDMIQDTTDKRAALQQADKAIYELGEATRLEKLGQWEKAAAQKLKAAETAANLQEKLATATASIEGNKISAKGSTDAATIRATSDEKVQGMRDVVDKLKIDSDAETRRQAARLSAQARQDDATGRTSDKDRALYQGAQQFGALVESRIDNIMKTPAYEQLRQTASMPESSTNKPIIDSAKKALKDYETSFAAQRKKADDALQAAESRVGITRSDAAPTSGATSQAEFDKKWPTLKSGQTLTGPDGKTYTKK